LINWSPKRPVSAGVAELEQIGGVEAEGHQDFQAAAACDPQRPRSATYKIAFSIGKFLKCTFPRFNGTLVFRSPIQERPRTFRAHETPSKIALP